MTYNDPKWVFISKLLNLIDTITSRRIANSFESWCTTEHQNFRIFLRKFKASLPLPFVFKCKPFLPRCLSMILSFSIYSIYKLEIRLLRFYIISAALPLSLRNVCLDTMTLHLTSILLTLIGECHLQSSLNHCWLRRLFQRVKLRICFFS